MKLKLLATLLLIIFSVSACEKSPKYAAGTEIQIKDYTRIYPLMYETDCIQYPSEEIKQKTNPDKWSDDVFHTGSTAIIISSSPHCSSDETVYIIESKGFYAAISEQGIE